MKALKIFLGCFLLLALAACKSSEAPTAKNPPTIIYFMASPSTIEKGEKSTLSWSTSDAATASIDQGIGSIAATGEKAVTPTATTTYTLTVGNPDGTTRSNVTVTVKEVAVMVLDGDPAKAMKSYGCPYFWGYVKNIGTVTGYNTKIEFRAYSDPNRKTIIDTASGFPADLGDIGPGQRAYFEAIFFNLNSWNQIKSWDYTITWLNKNLSPGQQIGIAIGWGR